MRRIIAIIVFWCLGLSLHAQVNDSIPFKYADFIRLVLKNHPFAKQADLKREEGIAYLLKAKGGFDPKLYSEIEGKEWDEVSYFYRSNSGLKVPTWFGIEAKVGYEYNQGQNLNPERSTPGSGLWYAGISVPVGKNLFIDERRAILKKAKIQVDLSENDRKLLLNNLLLDATNVYWEWYKCYQKMSIYEEGVKFAENRNEAVVSGFVLQEFAMVDTVESNVQLNDRKLELEKIKLDFWKASNALNTFLWTDEQVPLELNEKMVPVYEKYTAPLQFQVEIDTTIFIRYYDLKLKQLQIDRKLKLEQLKPQIDLQFNPLIQPTSNANLFLPYSVQNYKYGLQASFPIFIRKERGDLKLAQLKIKNTLYDREQKQLELEMKIKSLQQQLISLAEQLAFQEKMVESYLVLRDTEQVKFEMGESTLFLTNLRELKYLDSKLKLIDLQTYQLQTRASWDWQLGL